MFDIADYKVYVGYYKRLGYGFRIYYQKRTKGTLLAQNYCYYNTKEDAADAARDRVKMLMGIQRDLLDFSMLK